MEEKCSLPNCIKLELNGKNETFIGKREKNAQILSIA
jgi:hypothetical protein